MSNQNLTILQPIARSRHPDNDASLNAMSKVCNLNVINVVGMSDVGNARNTVAHRAYDLVRSLGGLVMWFDADMTLSDVHSFQLHMAITKATGKAISGRAIVRGSPNQVAASIDENEIRKEITEIIKVGEDAVNLKLTPILCGMACLMMPAEMFIASCDNAPARIVDNKITERYVCCPAIVPSVETEWEYLGEDHAYGLSIPGGAWLVELEKDNIRNYLDYGHISEHVLMHSPGPHILKTRS